MSTQVLIKVGGRSVFVEKISSSNMLLSNLKYLLNKFEVVYVKTDLHIKKKFLFIQYNSKETMKSIGMLSFIKDDILIRSRIKLLSNKFYKLENFIDAIHNKTVQLYIPTKDK